MMRQVDNKIFLIVIASGVTGALTPQGTKLFAASLRHETNNQNTVRKIFATWGWREHKILKIDEIL